MPKTTKKGQAKKSELPSTLQKSSPKAQRTFAKAHDSAAEEYGEGERAHRVAYSALKHSYEKVGDHWEKKDHKGPSDDRARSGGPNARGKTAEGVLAAFDAAVEYVAEAPKIRFTCTDPDDQHFLDLASQHKALLVSKDRAVLKQRKRVAILTKKSSL